MSNKPSQAPGAPGGPELWNPGSKSGVGTAISKGSPVWFTLGRGVIEEVFFPHSDHPRTRDLGLAVADGKTFFSWEKDNAESRVETLEIGVPAYRIINQCRRQSYRIEKTICAHPERPVVLQRTQFHPASKTDLSLYALLNVHLWNKESGWLGDYKGHPMMFASGDGVAAALACSAPWLKRSAGFFGTSDGWQDLANHKRMTWAYDRADGGNVVLTGQIDYPADGEFLLALAFGTDPAAAGLHALAAIDEGLDGPLARYAQGWNAWQSALLPLDDKTKRSPRIYRVSAAVLRTHESKQVPGAAVASLTVPFGQARNGDDTGGYHLVWPRDLAESTGGLLAAGSHERALPALLFFEATQNPDGHWAQNMWLNGEPHWNGIQMDETALVVLLLDLARREGAIDKDAAKRFWPMIRKAAAYLVRNGPATQQGRWEHDGGYSPFTLAAEIAALLSAADLAKENGESEVAHYLRQTADLWNAQIEAKTYVTNTALARRLGVEGYYVRIAPDKKSGPSSKSQKHSEESSISPDPLALVRFGLRAADDPRILNTVKAIDEVLKVDLGYGPGWRRYIGDKYGEYPDGEPFDNKGGIGRVWPLLAGERGHYELAAGRPDEAARMLRLMESAATATGLIPEQVWDADDIADKALFRGQSTTSACPLVWAHAEYIKLIRSLRDGKIFDQPEQTARRYAKGHHRPRMQVWRFEQKLRELCKGENLRIETLAAAMVRWSVDGWKKTSESATTDTGLGIHYVDLPTEHMPPGSEVSFTFHWKVADRWEDADFRVAVVDHQCAK